MRRSHSSHLFIHFSWLSCISQPPATLEPFYNITVAIYFLYCYHPYVFCGLSVGWFWKRKPVYNLGYWVFAIFLLSVFQYQWKTFLVHISNSYYVLLLHLLPLCILSVFQTFSQIISPNHLPFPWRLSAHLFKSQLSYCCLLLAAYCLGFFLGQISYLLNSSYLLLSWLLSIIP